MARRQTPKDEGPAPLASKGGFTVTARYHVTQGRKQVGPTRGFASLDTALAWVDGMSPEPVFPDVPPDAA